MPYFEIGEILQNEAQIIIYPSGSYTWFRVYCRLSSSSSAVVFDECINENGSFGMYVTGLSPETSYTVNVAYGTSYSDAVSSGRWIGAQTFTTPESSTEPDPDPEPDFGDGRVWIEGNWYQPYIFNGDRWVAVTPCIFNGSTWKETNG